MKNKNLIMLAIFLACLFAVSAVSAADNATGDAVSVDGDANEIIGIDENDVELDEMESSNGNDEVSASLENDSDLSSQNDGDALSSSPYSYSYSVSVSDVTVNYGSSGSIPIKISPASSSYSYRYDFYLKVYDSNGNLKINKNYYSSSYTTQITHSIGASELSTGTYTIKIVNYQDNYVMDTAKLTVKSSSSSTYTNPYYSAYSVSVDDVSIKYGSGGSIEMSITPASSSYYYRYNYYLKVYDSNGNEKISQRYYSTSSSYSKTYTLSANSLSAGTYTIKIINYQDNHVMDTAKLTVKKIDIQSQSVTGKSTDTIQYKVRVSENGYYISGLKVVFTCNGKDYTSTTDSQGYATLSVRLNAGTYEVTAKCEGVSNKNTIKVNSVYVKNDYKNPYVKSLTGYYNGKNKVSYGFAGYLKGYFRIFNGNDVVYEKVLDTTGYTSTGSIQYSKHDYYYEGQEINAVGTYRAAITDEYGSVLAQATITISKAPTHAERGSFTTLIGARLGMYAYVYDQSNSNKNIGGTAKVKIKGKTYKANVKNGVAIFKNIKFPLKAKTYKYKVTFSGDKNYKACSVNFKVKLIKTDMVILKKNRKMKIGKYTIKLSSKQYKSLVKAFNKGKSKTIKFNTKYKQKFKEPYTKTVKKYTTTKAVKTWYGASYMPMINKMRANGWTLVSEYTYNEHNPKNSIGIGLSSYTIAVCKWVKVSYKTAYKTKSYPVKAEIMVDKDFCVPLIELYSHGTTLKYKGIAVA